MAARKKGRTQHPYRTSDDAALKSNSDATQSARDDDRVCSFCDKPAPDKEYIVRGLRKARICQRCVTRSAKLIAEEAIARKRDVAASRDLVEKLEMSLKQK